MHLPPPLLFTTQAATKIYRMEQDHRHSGCA
ncbi:urease accessory protein UreD [Streptomyces sp. HF10]|nr:urease accessory protein UreD [Streptomyces sp. HF10]